MAARWTWLIAVLLALALTACGDRTVRRGDLPEAPPKGWDQLGLPPGWRVQEVPTAADANRLCRAAGVSAADTWNPRDITDCGIPSQHLVILSHTDDPVLAEAKRVHEFTHPWGPIHHDGRGWFWPNGQVVQPLSPSQIALMQSMAQAQYAQQMRTYQGLQAMSPGTPPVAGR